MCGFVVYFNPLRNRVLESAKNMAEAIDHRGPDGKGSYCYDEQLALVHRRLSIFDTSEAGQQPMHLGKLKLVFNGEIYNFVELREELTSLGHKFLSQTDTEVILHSYQQWGQNCLEKFNGMFSFVLLDESRNELFIARDRLGIKPLYYWMHSSGSFVIASEIKAICRAPLFKGIADWNSVNDYLRFGFVDHTEFTFFRGVNQIMPGSSLKLSLSDPNFNPTSWYRLEDQCNQEFSSVTQASCETNLHLNLNEHLSSSLNLRLRSDVKIGSCLSGGLDSSTIVSLISKIQNLENFETVTACYSNESIDEQRFVEELQKRLGFVWHKVFPDDVSLKQLDQLIYFQDQPFGSSSIYAQYEVFRKAKEFGITVMLDGQGADELLGGYSEYIPLSIIERLRSGRVIGPISDLVKLKRNIGLIKALRFGIMATSGSEWRKSLLKCGFPRRLDWLKTPSESGYYKMQGPVISVRDYSISQIKSLNLPALLRYEDRNSMAHGIEARVPFLDHRVVEFCLNLPSHFKVEGIQTKKILRLMGQSLLPQSILDRKDKIGFYTPEFRWLSNNKNLVIESIKTLIDFSPEAFDYHNLLKFCSVGLNDPKKYHVTIFRLLCLSRWIKTFDVKK